jgi:glycosyltransferase involved in cell wall biosynthesis
MEISIAMTTYNGEKYLSEQLESFLIQEIKPDELIVCDDGSTDKTLEILNNFSKKAPFDVRIYKNKTNLGYSKNFEKAILLCSGDLIFLSDQDDVWFKNKIKEVLHNAKLYPNKKIFIHDAYITHSNLKPTGQSNYDKLKAENKSSKDFTTGCLTTIKKEVVNILFPLPNTEKHDIWINKFGYYTKNRIIILEKLQYWRRHKNNTSDTTADKLNKVQFLITKIIQFFKHGNVNPYNALILKQENLEKLKKHIKDIDNNIIKKEVKAIACKNIEKDINIFKERTNILKKDRSKRFFLILVFFIKNGYSNFNGIWTAIKDLFSRNYNKT